MTDPQTIEEYLDELVVQLRGREPRLFRRVLSETEDHLRAAADRLEARGADRLQAEAGAIATFGSVRWFASQVPGRHRPLVKAVLIRQALLVLGIVLVSYGLSGLVLFGISRAAGDAAVIVNGQPDYQFVEWPKDGPCGHSTRTPGSCSDDALQSLIALTSAEARGDQVNAITSRRVAFGALGMVLLLGAFVVGIRWPGPSEARLSHLAVSVAAPGAGLMAAFWLYVAIDWQADGHTGFGWFAAFGLAALCAFGASLVWLMRVTAGWRSLPWFDRRFAAQG